MTVRFKLPAKARFHNHDANTFCMFSKALCSMWMLPNYEMKALKVHYYENNLRKKAYFVFLSQNNA